LETIVFKNKDQMSLHEAIGTLLVHAALDNVNFAVVAFLEFNIMPEVMELDKEVLCAVGNVRCILIRIRLLLMQSNKIGIDIKLDIQLVGWQKTTIVPNI
jgi:hypothetical protein